MNSPDLQRTVFLLLLAAVTAAFFWMLLPFFGAVLWAGNAVGAFEPVTVPAHAPGMSTQTAKEKKPDHKKPDHRKPKKG